MEKDIVKKGKEFIRQANKKDHGIFMIIEDKKDGSFGILSENISKNCMLNFMWVQVINDSDIRVRMENLIEHLKDNDNHVKLFEKFEANRIDLNDIL